MTCAGRCPCICLALDFHEIFKRGEDGMTPQSFSSKSFVSYSVTLDVERCFFYVFPCSIFTNALPLLIPHHRCVFHRVRVVASGLIIYYGGVMTTWLKSDNVVAHNLAALPALQMHCCNETCTRVLWAVDIFRSCTEFSVMMKEDEIFFFSVKYLKLDLLMMRTLFASVGYY